MFNFKMFVVLILLTGAFISIHVKAQNKPIQILVDPEKGNDQAATNNGMIVKTVGEAVRRSNGLKNTPVLIQVKAGEYREGNLIISGRTAPLKIEGVGGEAIITGADIWTDWKREGKYYTRDWPYAWGNSDYSDYPKGDLKHLKPVALRCEAVFVNDKLLRQVLDVKDMEPGSFMVDEKKKKITLQLPKNVNIRRAKIEVSVRQSLLDARLSKGLFLKNLAFIKANNGRQHDGRGRYAVFIAGEHAPGETNEKPDRNFFRDLVMEDVRIEWNGNSGLTMANVVGARFKNCKFNNNAVAGIGANRIKDIIYEDCEFNGNNWRLGKWGGVISWAPAGTKQLFIADVVFKGCQFNNNYATGLWLDFGNERVTVEKSEMIGNWDVGLYFEASWGPLLVKNSKIMNNGYAEYFHTHSGGLLMAESRDVTVENTLIANNANYQIGIRSRERPSTGYWSRKKFMGQCENLTVTRSVLIGGKYEGESAPDWFTDKHRTASLIARQIHSEEESYKRFLKTYKGDRNKFFSTISKDVFSTGETFGYKRIDLSSWQKLTGQDRRSRWTK